MILQRDLECRRYSEPVQDISPQVRHVLCPTAVEPELLCLNLHYVCSLTSNGGFPKGNIRELCDFYSQWQFSKSSEGHVLSRNSASQLRADITYVFPFTFSLAVCHKILQQPDFPYSFILWCFASDKMGNTWNYFELLC